MAEPPKKTVPQASAVPPNLGSYVLTVSDPAGNPVQALVSVFVPKLGDTKQVHTDKNGLAVVPDLPPGNVKVTVQPGAEFGPPPQSGSVFKPGPISDTVTIDPGPDPTDQDVVFTKPVAFLRVLVHKPDGKTPLVNVPVSGPVVPPKTVTDKGGNTPFFEVPPGTHSIDVGTSDLTVKPRFGPPNDPALGAIIGATTILKIVAIAEVAQAVVVLEEKRLEIVKIDDHFVPSKETLDIRFAIAGLSGRRVILTIEGENYPGKKLVERDLAKGETSDGLNNLIPWTGKIEMGPMKDQFAWPLLGPFKVTLFHDDLKRTGLLKDEKKFKILYHSVELKEGPLTPDEKEPDKAAKEKDWVQFHLNKLGYYGGPVGKDTDSYLDKAVIRYKANHKNMYEFFVDNYKATIDQKLKDALAAGDNKRPFLVGNPLAGPGNTGKVMVEELYYQRTGTTLMGSGAGDDFGKPRGPFDSKFLNRPLIPIEVTVFLKGKDNSKQLVPEVVGPLRISFRMKDPNEDLSKQLSPTAAEPSQTKKYLEGALAVNSGRSGDNGDNCPDTLNGLRKATPGASFDTPFLLGDFYQPYTTASDAGQKVVFSHACVDSKFPLRLGKAGIYFRPSYIAGDDYQLRAEIDFTGHASQAALEADHGATDVSKRIHADTGTFVVTRFGKLAVVVNWPARTKNAPQYDLIQAEYARAHVELDVGSISTKNITDVLTNAEYTAVITGTSGITPPPGLALRASSYYGAAPPAQGSQNAATYKTLLQATTIDGYFAPSSEPMGAQIAKKIRSDFPLGMVLVTINQHDPVDVQNDPAHGNHTVALANRQFIAGYRSVGLADGILIVDMQDPDKVYYVVAHEFGHQFYLVHHENADDSNPTNHDTNDHNCLMSYSKRAPATPAFQAEGVYVPHFCGKCNLNLRGWDITNALVPAHS